MARPTLVSEAAASGLPGRDGAHYAVADGNEAFARRALELLAQPETARQMGEAARRLVLETTSWPAMLAPLAGIVGVPPQPKSQRDAA